MRYRSIYYVKYSDGLEKFFEMVSLADNITDARKKVFIELTGSYKNNKRVTEYRILSTEEDSVLKPTFDFVKEKLIFLNDLSKSKLEHQEAINRIYETFRKYSPQWNDDYLSDIISYCKEGELGKLIKENEDYYKSDGLDIIVNNLLEELDSEWVCYYRPDISLESQFLKAIY